MMRNFGATLRILALALALASPAMAADRSITQLPETDLPGGDYETIKGTALDQCEAACLGDNICRAYTFNEKAKWCFLKGSAGEPAQFPGASSGRIDLDPTDAELAQARMGELPFPPQYYLDNARTFVVDLPYNNPPPKDLTYADLVADGAANLERSNYDGAMASLRQALSIVANDPAVWQKLAEAAVAKADAEFERFGASDARDPATVGLNAALNGFIRSETQEQRAAFLGLIGQSMERLENWSEAIASFRASLDLIDNGQLQARLDKVIAQHGFRITSNDVDAEAPSPRICVTFSAPLPTGDTDLSGYVVAEGAPQASVEVRGSQLCLEGVEHGKRYAIRLRAGLPSGDGETLQSDVNLSVFVPDRPPFVGFANTAYVMPKGLGGGLPITSVNAEKADIQIYRIGDRSIATAVRNGVFQSGLDGYSAEEIADRSGELSWEGTLELAEGQPNALVTTAIPVTDAIATFEPGAYVITARVSDTDQEYWQQMATQWFIVTDLGLTTVSGDDGVHAFVRALGTARPVADADVRLVAVNNEILGQGRTDANGQFVFPPGLARGKGGRAPQLLVAETDGGDYAFLDLSKSAFDLTDRGVEGRPSPGPLDVFATTERGVYRPGETVYLTALVRDPLAKAVTGLPITMRVERPDGVVAESRVLEDAGAGGYSAALPMVADAMRGAWQIRLYADTKAGALATATFLVEDFEPERLAFEIEAPETSFTTEEANPVSIAARYLYGATAPGLDIEADAVLRPVTTLADFPGYSFGRRDDTAETTREPLGVVATTDDEGNADAEIDLPAPPATTRPLQAQLVLRLVDTNGRAVERTLTRPVKLGGDAIGLKPQFQGDVPEGEQAKFDVIVVDADGQQADRDGLAWTLSRIDTNYQWYREGGVWKWEAITTNTPVADGTLDAKADAPVSIAADVDWGRYSLEVESSGEDATSSSYEFYAGYYYVEAGSDTPDTLQVALDKTAYRAGDTAVLKLDPQFAGTALVMVVDNRVIDMKAVDVPAEGASVELPVTKDWGPGAYVTAVLYRPSDTAEKRMPSRALGLAYADVDPGDLKLETTLSAPAEALPRQPFTAKVQLANVQPGEKAYVTVAAVDLGILNLTNFKVPDPDGWYFGQRQLGTEFRDLYGQLIDPTQGLAGALRSGGDGGASRLGTPPPTSVLVALHSGVVPVGEDGTASVDFDMPDFNGTVRVMAIAWTQSAVGHASADVVVRDPVVVTLSPPRFMRVGDTARLLVEVNNVSGEAGQYDIALQTSDAITTDTEQSQVSLDQGARAAIEVPLTATRMGDHDLDVTITAPGGETLVKHLVLGVRATSGPRTTTELLTVEPGETVTIDASYMADLSPHTGTLTLSVGSLARLDVAKLLMDLDRYPYGCAEQVTSRAMPLLYLNSVAETIGLGTDDALDQRVRDAIADVLSKQTSAGSFGLWGPFSSTDLWLDSYVTDFLVRAKAAGYEVSEAALTRALDNLANQVSYASDFEKGGEDLAYALYDLARSGRAAIGDLRYYLEARLNAFNSPLAKAQLGAALALYGDRTRSGEAFAAAIADLSSGREDRTIYRKDYGSRLRDTAGVLALAAEFKPAGVDLAKLADDLANLRDAQTYTSTQDNAWTLLAAAALADQAGDGSVTLDGEPLTGSVYRRFDQEHFDADSVTITNTANQKTEIRLAIFGIPAEPPPASNDGIDIERQFYTPDGTAIDPEEINQNDRFVVVLTATPERLGSGQFVISDPLPGGFEIENPNLSDAEGVSALPWLTLDYPAHVEARTDQFVAAFRYYSDTKGFTTAYMVRAVTPGSFTLPGASVEDMYRPEWRGNTDAAKIVIAPQGAAVETRPAAVPAAPQRPAGGKRLDNCANGCPS